MSDIRLYKNRMPEHVKQIREQIIEGLTIDQVNLVEEHLRKRFEKRKIESDLKLVYDVLPECNLQCRGCSVNPIFVNQTTPITEMRLKPSFEQVLSVLWKVKRYVDNHGKTCFINFGGGEPFLRKDFDEIVIKASELFGSNSIGVDTNGTIDGQEARVEKLQGHFSYLGVSIDGLEEYHNWWRGGRIKGGAFKKTMSFLREIINIPLVIDNIEVTSVATRDNLDQIPRLMDLLHDLGVRKYSVHRAMPVGRMSKMHHLVPNAKQYFRLLVTLVESASKMNMDVHLHHSIESIYTTLLLGFDTYTPVRIGNPDACSSLGILPGGEVVFDPWTTTGVHRTLVGGNLLDDEELDSIFERVSDKPLSHSRMSVNREFRCYGCEMKCSGGSRTAAATQHVMLRRSQLVPKSVTADQMLESMIAVDPACPLYVEEE